ncbi:hypothetical protein Hanom_Chr14g01300701 [Helianthus anomalus]
MALYSEFFLASHFRLRIRVFLASFLTDYGVHISQMHPMGMIWMTQLEFCSKDLRIEPIREMIHVFYKLFGRTSQYSFAQHTRVKCMRLSPCIAFMTRRTSSSLYVQTSSMLS